MAPKRLLLEGPAIEPLLEKVWAEHGSDVTIVKAERVRVGGVAGFFAREQFEVTVEVPDTPLATTPAPPPAARTGRAAPKTAPGPGPRAASVSAGIDALLAAAEEADAAAPRPHQDFDAIFSARTAASAAAVPAAAPELADDDDPWVDAPLPAPPAARSPVPAPSPSSDLAERLAAAWAAQNARDARSARGAEDVERPVAGPPAPVELPTAALTHDDDGARDLASDDPWAPTALPAVHASSPADDEPAPPEPVALEDFALLAEAPVPAETSVLLPEPEAFDPAQHASAAASAAGAAPAPRRRVGRSFARLPGAPAPVPDYALERSAVLRMPETPSFPPPVTAAGSAAVPAPVLTSLGLFPPPPAETPALHVLPDAYGQHDVQAVHEPHLHQVHAPAPRYLPAPPAHDHDRHLPERLADLGVPAAWLWDLPLDRPRALRELSARIAGATSALAAGRRRSAPVAEPVVVVLADLEDALPVALHLATGMGLDEVDVVVGGRRAGSSGGRLAPSRLELQDAVADAREVGSSLVVVLPAPVGAAPAARAAVADTLEVLEADEVWAVVDATRRLDDTAAWLTAVTGDRGVDALALANAEVTSAPAAALGLPAPVVLVGDRPASPQAWVSMLAARLAEQDLR